MTENLNEQVVVAFFEDLDAADGAAKALMGWDKANEEIKLGSIGSITLKDGEVALKRYGMSTSGRAAMLGGALGFVAAGVTGGLSLIVGAVGGSAVGGLLGKLDHERFGLSDASLEEIKQHLEQGGAGLVVLCDDFEVTPTMQELEKAGGKAQSFGVSVEVLKALQGSKAEQHRWDTQTRNIEKGM